MRSLFVVCGVFFLSATLLSQTVVRAEAVPGCCGPYIPLVTTPMVSLHSVSPHSAGATNATWGLQAGASNSTLSILNGDTSSVFTQPVWYEGGTTPVLSHPSVELPGRPEHMEMMQHVEHMQHMEGEHHGNAPAAGWTYYASADQAASAVEASAAAKSGKHAARTITNQDIDQENQKTGTVKYSGKTEQIK
jgi:hypothetical protein